MTFRKSGNSILVKDGQPKKLGTKFGYASWHPSGRLLIYSINNVVQVQHFARSEVRDVFEKGLTAGLDEQARARTNVLTALAIGQICTAPLTKHLPKLMKNQSKSVRLAAAKAVFLCGRR